MRPLIAVLVVSTAAATVAVAGCKKKSSTDAAALADAGAARATPGGGPSGAPGAPAAGAAAPGAGPASPMPGPREGGPSRAQCETFADHTAGFLAESMTPPGATAEQKQYVDGIVKGERDFNVRFCLAALEVPEVECVLAASDFPALAQCERLRRQVPKEMLGRNEVTADDCERFFVRYKQFMMIEGVPPAQIDASKEQLTRTCLDKARPGTLACYLTAATYEEARRCP